MFLVKAKHLAFACGRFGDRRLGFLRECPLNFV